MPLLGGGRPDPGRLRTCGMLVVPGCSRSCPLSSPYSICASLTYIMDQAGAFPSVLDCIRPSALSKKNQNQSINHAGADAEHQHRPGHHEQLGRRSGDESLWLCQDRHTVFSEFFQLPPKWGAYCFSLPLQIQTRSKYAYLSQSLLKGTHEPALQNF